MSAPVGRETPQRRTAQHRRGIDSLSKRPAPAAPASADPVLEWFRTLSNTDLGATYTTLDWTNGSTEGHDTSATPPTFDLNASANIEIGIGGVYGLDIAYQGFALINGVDSVLFFEWRRIAGAIPTWARGGMGSNPVVPQVTFRAEATPDILQFPDPLLSVHFAVQQGDIDSVGATEFEVKAYLEEDGSGVAHAEGSFFAFLTRHGAAYE